MKVIAPKGTIFNPNFPRACFSRFCQVQRVVDNTILALADTLPQQVTAGNSAGIHFCSYSGFVPETGEYWLYLEVNEGSYGGRYGKDAMDSVDNLMANTRNNPIEELDLRFPVRCDQYELRPEPAAPGKWRGGIGIVRRNRFLVDGTYSCEGDRQYDPPRGIFGGWKSCRPLDAQEPQHAAEEYLEAKVTGIEFKAGEYIESASRAAAATATRSARPRDGPRGRPRRLHHDRARARRLRGRVRRRARLRGGRRGAERRRAEVLAARNGGASGSLDELFHRASGKLLANDPPASAAGDEQSGWREDGRSRRPRPPRWALRVRARHRRQRRRLRGGPSGGDGRPRRDPPLGRLRDGLRRAHHALRPRRGTAPGGPDGAEHRRGDGSLRDDVHVELEATATLVDAA